jgi:hypothetical protein
MWPTKETPEDALTPFKMDPWSERKIVKKYADVFNEFWTANDVRDYTELDRNHIRRDVAFLSY